MVDDLSFLRQPNGVERLRVWLADRPFDWGIWLATRAAWRIFPVIVEAAPADWLARNTLPLFHALFSSTSSFARLIKGHKKAALVSSGLLFEPAQYKSAEGYYSSGLRNVVSAVAAKAKIDKVDSAVRSISLFETSLHLSSGHNTENIRFSIILEEDVKLLLSHNVDRSIQNSMGRLPSVRQQMGSVWFSSFTRSLDRIVALDPTFSIWRDWAIGAVSNRKFNFFEDDFATDAAIRDRQISLAIVQQLDQHFWSRSANLVNSEIGEWVNLAAAGVMGDPSLQPSIPIQNENAISFSTNVDGKITLSGMTHFGEVRSDDDTNDRYFECTQLARELISKCEGSNAGARLVSILKNYIEAASVDINSIRPSLFVQRGDRIRNEIAAYNDPQNMLPPLSDEILLDLKSWQAAHNLFVGLDPSLMARDAAMAGPDARVADISPQELRTVVSEADSAGILAEEVVDVVNEAADLAPSTPDPSNRRTVWSFETGRNLIIETFNLAMKFPVRSTIAGVVGVSAVSTVGFSGAIGSGILAAVPAAKFLLKHQTWIESRLGDSPTWKSLFISLIDWLENNTPLKSEKD